MVFGLNDENEEYSEHFLIKQLEHYDLSQCFDFHDWCSDWSNIFEECDKNPGYMHHYCAKSCQTCHKQTKEFRYEQILNSLEDCSNLHFGCSWWAYLGECKKNAHFMNKHCPLSCHACPLQVERFRDEYCLDSGSYDECQYYFVHQQCHEESLRDILHEKCRKTCNLCSYPNITYVYEESNDDSDIWDITLSILTQLFIFIVIILLFVYYFVNYLSIIIIYLFCTVHRSIVRALKSVFLSALYEYEVVC